MILADTLFHQKARFMGQQIRGDRHHPFPSWCLLKSAAPTSSRLLSFAPQSATACSESGRRLQMKPCALKCDTQPLCLKLGESSQTPCNWRNENKNRVTFYEWFQSPIGFDATSSL